MTLSFRKIFNEMNNPINRSNPLEELPNFSDPGAPMIGTRGDSQDRTMSHLAMPLQNPDAGGVDAVQYPIVQNDVFSEIMRRAELTEQANQEKMMEESEVQDREFDVQFIQMIVKDRPDLLIKALMSQQM